MYVAIHQTHTQNASTIYIRYVIPYDWACWQKSQYVLYLFNLLTADAELWLKRQAQTQSMRRMNCTRTCGQLFGQSLFFGLCRICSCHAEKCNGNVCYAASTQPTNSLRSANSRFVVFFLFRYFSRASCVWAAICVAARRKRTWKIRLKFALSHFGFARARGNRQSHACVGRNAHTSEPHACREKNKSKYAAFKCIFSFVCLS